MVTKREIKRIIALLLSATVVFSSQLLTAHAHNSDYFSGTYTASQYTH